VAALTLATHLGASLDACLAACRDFQGAARRFEVIAAPDDIVVVDDYGHHPTEVAVTVAAARQRYPDRRLIVVNVPHTYSRTREFLEDYRRVFSGAALVILGPIEAARERHLPATVSSEDVAARARETSEVLVVDDADAAVAAVAARARPGDVVLCISLGGFDKVAQRMVEGLQRRHAPA
jgi:UDP-N-acetylmuramate--alanine ligase